MTDADRNDHHHPIGEASEADQAEQDRAWSEDEDEEIRLTPDVPEADALEQSRAWGRGGGRPRPRMPADVSESDFLDQERPADIDEDDERQ